MIDTNLLKQMAMALDCRQQNMFWSFQIVLSCLGSTNATVHENNGKHVAFRLYFLCSIAHNSICIWQKCLNITEENSISTRDQKNLKHPKLHFTRPEGDRNREPMWPVRKSGGPLRTPSFSDRFRRLYLKSQKKSSFSQEFFKLIEINIKCLIWIFICLKINFKSLIWIFAW